MPGPSEVLYETSAEAEESPLNKVVDAPDFELYIKLNSLNNEALKANTLTKLPFLDKFEETLIRRLVIFSLGFVIARECSSVNKRFEKIVEKLEPEVKRVEALVFQILTDKVPSETENFRKIIFNICDNYDSLIDKRTCLSDVVQRSTVLFNE